MVNCPYFPANDLRVGGGDMIWYVLKHVSLLEFESPEPMEVPGGHGSPPRIPAPKHRGGSSEQAGWQDQPYQLALGLIKRWTLPPKIRG